MKATTDMMESSNRRRRENVLVDESHSSDPSWKICGCTRFFKLNLGNLSKMIVNFQDGSVDVSFISTIRSVTNNL